MTQEGTAEKSEHHSANTRARSPAQKRENQAPRKLPERGASRDETGLPRLKAKVTGPPTLAAHPSPRHIDSVFAEVPPGIEGVFVDVDRAEVVLEQLLS